MLRVAPSVLSADPAYLARDIRRVARHADFFHLDIMDGHFVPNLTSGPDVVASINTITRKPLEAHLMLSNPDAYIRPFVEAGADVITVHAESDISLIPVLRSIRALGVNAGVALNPETRLSALDRAWAHIDYLLLMTVHPGFGGQTFIRTVLPKIREARKRIDMQKRSIPIAVDGGINSHTAPLAVAAGADTLIAGSYIFRSKHPADAIDQLRKGNKKRKTA